MLRGFTFNFLALKIHKLHQTGHAQMFDMQKIKRMTKDLKNLK